MSGSRLAAEPTSRPGPVPMEPTQIAVRVVAVLLAVLPLTLILTAAAWSAPRDTAALEADAPRSLGRNDVWRDWAPYVPAEPVEPAQE